MSTFRLSKLQKWILKEALVRTGIHSQEARSFFGKEYPDRYSRNFLYAYEVEKIDKNKIIKKSEKMREWNYETRQYEVVDKENYYIRSDLITTPAIEATISRCFKNLVKKDLLYRLSDFGNYYQKGSVISPRLGDVMKNFGGKPVFLPDNYGKYFLTEKGYVNAKNILIDQTFLNAKESATRCNVDNVKNNTAGANIINFKDYQDKVSVIIKEAISFFMPRKEPSPEKQQKTFELKMLLNQFTGEFTVDAIRKVCCSECQKKIDQFAIKCGLDKLQALKKEIEEMS